MKDEIPEEINVLADIDDSIMDNYFEYKKLISMKVNEEIKIGEFSKYTILRVPGGWIYFLNRTMTTCFVPFVNGNKI